MIKSWPKILYIEDDKISLRLVESYLASKGYEVDSREDVESALRDLKSGALLCDLVITDLLLPGHSGIDFIRISKDSGFDFPIILLTGHYTVETANDAINAGAYDFIVKPVHFPQLLLSVERAYHMFKVKKENKLLREAIQLKEAPVIDGIIGLSPNFIKMLTMARRVADSDSVLLITGESGTGKEVIARAIHNISRRGKAPFIAINCSSIPENLLESELFGHAKGAFTGAVACKRGLFEEANFGTLFLDEIGELAPHLQAKLLRVLQERKIKRVGENQYRNINVRIISASNRDLRREVKEGHFREDLFFRLNVIQIKIPALRDRREDIIPLAEFFLQKFNAINDKSRIRGFTQASLQSLLDHPWPGNIRELENSIERAVILTNSEYISPDDLFGEGFIDECSVNQKALANSRQETKISETIKDASHVHGEVVSAFFNSSNQVPLTVDEVVNNYIRHVLIKNHGIKEKTARELNIDRKTLYRRIEVMNRPISN